MDMETAVRTVFSKYATFSGRAGRAEYWYFQLFYFLVMIATLMLQHIVLNNHMFLFDVLAFGLVIPAIAVAVRRLHDLDKSGWLYLLAFIPFVSLLLLYWFCSKGTDGTNRFGPQPA